MKKRIYILLLTILLFSLNVKNVYAKSNNPTISYTTHVQNIGWQDYVKDGAMAGTSGLALRLEGIKIKINNSDYDGDVEYRTHVQNIGWQDYVKNGEMSGTSGLALRLEAIQIRLTGELAEHYDIYYRVHAQNFGWMNWAKNGEMSGTSGFAYRLEGIEIILMEKDSVPEMRDNTDYRYPFKDSCGDPIGAAIKYTTHVENVGWQSYSYDGDMAGTSGLALRLEGIKIDLLNKKYSGDVEYRTHVQNIGWQDYVKNGEMSGTSGLALRLEAIQIRLTGELAEHYDIYYRVHAQNFGWLGWAKNNEMSGTAGFAYRLEGIEIKLIDKNEVFKGKTSRHFIQMQDGYYLIDDSNVQVVDEKHLINRERELINQIDGYYWYLEGYDAYIKIDEIEWYGHHILQVVPWRMEYYKGKIVAEGDEEYLTYKNDTEPKTDRLEDLLKENPSETGTKLITKYNMYVNDDKLYISINNSVYTFEKSITKKPVSLSLDINNLVINRGETQKLDLAVKYYNTKHNIDVKSSKPNVATCGGRPTTSNGYIEISCYGKNVGDTKIRIEDLEGGNYVEFNVRVNYAKIYPNSIKISNIDLGTISSLDMVKGDYIQLGYFTEPSDADYTTATWSSSNISIAYVNSNGKVYANSKGTAIITVTNDYDPNVKATCIVNVSNPPLTTTSDIQAISNSIKTQVYAELNINGGTGIYSCDYIKVYKDDELIETDDCSIIQNTQNNNIRIFNMFSADDGNYRVEYKFHDSDGDISEGVTETINVPNDSTYINN